MARSIAVIGIDYVPSMGMKRLIGKLRKTMKEPGVRFYHCNSSGWEIYRKVLELTGDKIIILDQFASDQPEDITSLNYLTINDRILIVGINPIFFSQRIRSRELGNSLELVIFQIKRLIISEVTLDSYVSL